MGRGTYSDEELPSLASDSDSENEAFGGLGSRSDPRIRDPEVWEDSWSEELVAAFHALREQCRANGWSILDAEGPATFNDFCAFCHAHSSRVPPPV